MWYNSGLNISLAGCEAPTSRLSKKARKIRNENEFRNWFIKLMDDALNRYHFNGLPDTVSERVLVQSLLWYGAVTFFTKDGTLLCLPSAPTNQFNIYGEPAYSWVWSRNGYNKKVKLTLPNGDAKATNTGFGKANLSGDGEGVFLRETRTMYPFIYYVISYAEKIADGMRVIDGQKTHMKRPYLIKCQEEQVKSVIKMLDDLEDNSNYVVLNSGAFSTDSIDVVPVTVQATELKGMQELIEWYLNQFRELCGISNNPSVNKKERVLTDEVNANNEETEWSVCNVVDYINEQLKLVNQKFGTNIVCEKNKSAEEDIEIEEDEDNDNAEDNATDN